MIQSFNERLNRKIKENKAMNATTEETTTATPEENEQDEKSSAGLDRAFRAFKKSYKAADYNNLMAAARAYQARKLQEDFGIKV